MYGIHNEGSIHKEGTLDCAALAQHSHSLPLLTDLRLLHTAIHTSAESRSAEMQMSSSSRRRMELAPVQSNVYSSMCVYYLSV